MTLCGDSVDRGPPTSSNGCDADLFRVRYAVAFDSLAGTVCDTPGHSVTRTRQTTEYVRHVLTRDGQSPLNPRVGMSLMMASEFGPNVAWKAAGEWPHPLVSSQEKARRSGRAG
jgi:hypothetical protein